MPPEPARALREITHFGSASVNGHEAEYRAILLKRLAAAISHRSWQLSHAYFAERHRHAIRAAIISAPRI